MGKHLNLSQRIIIESKLNENISLRKIGEMVGKPHTTISREILSRRVLSKGNRFNNFNTFCKSTDTAPFVCNCCPNKRNCKKNKYFYYAKDANDDYCKILTPVIPVRMMEAWMLADKELLKSEIGTTKSDNDLKINRDPETIADPKAVIEEAIRIAQSDLPKRRQRLTISDLYAIIGDKISINKLLSLDSYQKFQDEVRATYRTLNYMP